MDTKILINASFHRFVPTEEDKPERREAFAAGQTVTVSEADATDWIAKDLAKLVETPNSDRRAANRPARDETASG